MMDFIVVVITKLKDLNQTVSSCFVFLLLNWLMLRFLWTNKNSLPMWIYAIITITRYTSDSLNSCRSSSLHNLAATYLSDFLPVKSLIFRYLWRYLEGYWRIRESVRWSSRDIAEHETERNPLNSLWNECCPDEVNKTWMATKKDQNQIDWNEIDSFVIFKFAISLSRRRMKKN